MDSSFWFCVFDNNNHQAKSPCLSFSTNSRTSRSRCACYREKSSSQSNSSSGRTQTLISCTLIFLPVRPQMYSIVIGIISIRPTNQFLLNLIWCDVWDDNDDDDDDDEYLSAGIYTGQGQLEGRIWKWRVLLSILASNVKKGKYETELRDCC